MKAGERFSFRKYLALRSKSRGGIEYAAVKSGLREHTKQLILEITEGGETSFVIGTAWKGVEVGAKVYFVYNNPDDILCAHVERSKWSMKGDGGGVSLCACT
jgi:hypothetical protein